MRYTVRVSIVSVIGHIWMPNVVGATDYTLTSHDLENMVGEDGTITRDDVEDWLSSHAGDFQSVDDFSASIEFGDGTLDFPWESEDSEMTYNECMFTEED